MRTKNPPHGQSLKNPGSRWRSGRHLQQPFGSRLDQEAYPSWLITSSFPTSPARPEAHAPPPLSCTIMGHIVADLGVTLDVNCLVLPHAVMGWRTMWNDRTPAVVLWDKL